MPDTTPIPDEFLDSSTKKPRRKKRVDDEYTKELSRGL